MGELIISGKELLKKIEKKGGTVERSKGSHHLVKFDNHITIIPIHGNDDLPKGTLRKILRDLGLEYEDIK